MPSKLALITLLLFNVHFQVESTHPTGGCLVKPAYWDDSQVPLYKAPRRLSNLSLPASFDARTAWPECTDVISRIGDQANCGSCWAFAVAQTISDRICIASKGDYRPVISPQDIMECTSNELRATEVPSRKEVIGGACAGGWPAAAWAHYVNEGVVTGSNDASVTGCKPYLFSCTQRGGQQYCPFVDNLKLSCLSDCHNSKHWVSYSKDRFFGSTFSRMSLGKGNDNVNILKMVIATQGSVSAGIDGNIIGDPINSNEEGIFVKEGFGMDHAIRIIGWGVSEKVGSYWIIANSWGDTWNGDGTAKVAFGAASIGEDVTFGIPKL